MAEIKIPDITECWQGCGSSGTLIHNCTNILENCSSKITYIPTITPIEFTPRHLLNRNANRCP